MNRLKKALIPILSVLCILSVTIMIIALCNDSKDEAVFVPPSFDAKTIEGTPKPPQELGWSEIYQDGMNYKVGICGRIKIDNNEADIYFSNVNTNDVWLKLRIIDEQNNIISETGLIKPNEYIKSVRFNTVPENGEKVKIKIMGYEPDTYYSVGSITLNTNIEIGGK